MLKKINVLSDILNRILQKYIGLYLGALILLISYDSFAVQEFFTQDDPVEACFAQYNPNPLNPPCGSCAGAYFINHSKEIRVTPPITGLPEYYPVGFYALGLAYRGNALTALCIFYANPGLPCSNGKTFVGPAPGSCKDNDKQYVIKISPYIDSAESNAILGSIEPRKSIKLMALVFDETGQVAKNVDIKLETNIVDNSGGHFHDDDRNTKQMGILAVVPPDIGTATMNGKILEGTTGDDGLSFVFTAPAPAGDHKIIASCKDGKNCRQEGPDTVWVGIKNLAPLPASEVYVILPNINDPKHPDNHYLTYTAMLRITTLAAFYHGQFPNDPPLHLNDASLERGGIFDFNYQGRNIWWTPPHFEHCRGTEIDIRANLADGAIPESNFPEFDRIAKRVGADSVRECKADENKQCIVSTRHYHLRLTGVKPKCP